MLQALLRQLLPGICLLCEGHIPSNAWVDLCGHCLASLPWNVHACQRCALPLEAQPGLDLCSECLRHPPPFARALAPLRYEGASQAWVVRLKDRLGMVEGAVLGTILAEAAAHWYTASAAAPGRPPDVLIPVPISARRLARRGHNQALTLAQPVARRLGIPLLRLAVTRQQPRQRQRGLGRRARLTNPQGSFRVRRAEHIENACVAIVDDVTTTGATAAELTRVLLQAGAGEVHLLSATRTPAPGERWHETCVESAGKQPRRTTE